MSRTPRGVRRRLPAVLIALAAISVTPAVPAAAVTPTTSDGPPIQIPARPSTDEAHPASPPTAPTPESATSRLPTATPDAGGSATSGSATSGSAIVPGAIHRTSLAIQATYDANVQLSLAHRTLRGRVTITAQNQSGNGVDRLELNTVMAKLGHLRLGSVTVDGGTVGPTISGQTIVVPLGGILPDGETTVVVVSFAATLRSNLAGSNWLFTKANGIVDMYRWIPWISRKRTFKRPNYGDPFVTPVSPRVTVTIRSDRKVRYGNTGSLIARSGDGLTRTFRATNVRDFVVTASTGYRAKQVRVGDNIVRVVYRPGFRAAAALRAARKALTKIEARLGPYPYHVLKVVQSAGAYGMEGPGVAWIPTGTGSNLAYLVTHEIAHQWFYGLVGNDQAREPFADEAVTDFVARDVLRMRRSSRCAKTTLDRSIYRYSFSCYYEAIYIQGGNLLSRARKKVGSATFWAALRGYVADHRWQLVHTRTLLDALDDATPLDLEAWWRSRFPSLY
jgi:hypothetical protein